MFILKDILKLDYVIQLLFTKRALTSTREMKLGLRPNNWSNSETKSKQLLTKKDSKQLQ
jgi:hypothetical protein